MKKLKLSALTFAIISLTTFSCKNENREDAQTLEVEEVENITPGEAETTTAATDAVNFDNAGLQTVFGQYIDVKNALVASKVEEAKNAASQMELTLTNIEANSTLKEATAKIAGSNDINEQRKAFHEVSNELEKLIENSVESGIVYKQYCPMAFEGKGASWLTVSQIIQNPYYGDKMLKCGSVEKTFE